MAANPTMIKGRMWVIRDADGKAIDNIDTDMIFHNAHIAITDINEMGKHAFAKKGDIIITGGNFGAGSSRQQAVDCFISLGIGGLVAESFGAIYKRNAINTAFPILECPGIMDANIENGHEIEIDIKSGRITNATTGQEIPGLKPFSKVQMDIYNAGSLFKVTP